MCFDSEFATFQVASSHGVETDCVCECSSVLYSPSGGFLCETKQTGSGAVQWLSPATTSWLRTFLFPVKISTIPSTCSCSLYRSRDLSSAWRCQLWFDLRQINKFHTDIMTLPNQSDNSLVIVTITTCF